MPFEFIMTLKTLKPWLLLGLVFLAGVILGVAGTRLAVRRYLREAVQHPAQAQHDFAVRLGRKLRLDPAQQAKFNEILGEASAQLNAIKKQSHPAVVLVYSNANAQLTGLLTPDQKVRFDQFKADNAVFIKAMQTEP